MNLPGFNAESSLGPAKGIYRGRIGPDRTNTSEVSMQLDDPTYPGIKGIQRVLLKNWDKLFESTGPLEETCDTGGADCARRCTDELNSQKQECSAISDESQRLECYQDAVDRAGICQDNCSMNYPPTFGCPSVGLPPIIY